MFWTRQRRDIFQYWDGVRKRSIDPEVAWKLMWSDPDCVIKDDFKSADAGDVDAWDRIQAMGRRMFGVKAYSDTQPGLTEHELSKLIGEFVRYMGVLKKKQEKSRTLWALSVGGLQGASTTQPESESSSTPSESKSEEPLATS